MSDLGIDALDPLPVAQVYDAASSPSRTSPARPPVSLLDDWENWPENDPRFDPAFDAVWPLSEGFCKGEGPDCQFCSETKEAFHVCEDTVDGRSAMDKKVNTKELHDRLQELQRRDKSNVRTPDYPSVRLFFACGNYARDALKYNYMRHFLAYCRIPPHFVLRTSDLDPLPVFQAAYKPTDGGTTPLNPQRGILHIYLHFFTYVMDADMLASPEYYSEEFLPRVRSWLNGSRAMGTFGAISPTLYLRYDESSRESVVYVADSTMTYHSLRGIFAAGVSVANRDPFLVVAAFLHHRVAELHKYVLTKRTNMDKAIIHANKLASLETDGSALFVQFGFLAIQGPSNARMRHEASSMLRALEAIEAEHCLFLERNVEAQGDDARTIQLRFQRQRAQLLEIESSFSALVSGIEIVKDLMIGRAQIVNGIEMATMAKDNQKQAEATEALARDARRDSEIMKRDSATMKTITVVTLVYLPATFVSTLLSMGLFDFGLDDGGDRRLHVAPQGWVFLAIALPLTILTLGLAFLWKQSKERQWRREAQAESTGNGNEAGPVVSADTAPASRRRFLAMFQGLRRRPGGGPQDAPQTDLEMANVAARSTDP